MKRNKNKKVLLLASLLVIQAVGTPKEVATATEVQSAQEYRLAKSGWINNKRIWRFVDSQGRNKTGWLKDKGSWYFLNSTGIMQTGWQKVNNQWYYMNSSGRMLTGWTKVGKDWYYLHSSGKMLTGWQKINNQWYYMNKSGRMETGWTKVGGDWYYLHSSGRMLTGWQKINNQWYYMDGSGRMQTGWLTLGNKKYYLQEDGSMFTGTMIDGDWEYTFNRNGELYHEVYIPGLPEGPLTPVEPSTDPDPDESVNGIIEKFIKMSDEEKYNRAKENLVGADGYLTNQGVEYFKTFGDISKADVTRLEKAISIDKLNQEMEKLINKHRSSLRLQMLEYDSFYQGSTDYIAGELSNSGFLVPEGQKAHYLPNGNRNLHEFNSDKYHGKHIGVAENLSMTYNRNNPFLILSEKHLAEHFFNQWMNSPGHRANIEDPDFNGFTFSVSIVKNGNTQTATAVGNGYYTNYRPVNKVSGVGVIGVMHYINRTSVK